MRTITLKTGEHVPILGLGTWRMGERKSARGAEINALRLALDLGVRLIDTAEMYGEGAAEEIVGEAIAGKRDGLFLVSKVYPHNASRRGTIAACERSLRRLSVDHLDLYLLHWRGSTPLAETVEALERLRGQGKIRRWGVSNFATEDMAELADLAAGPVCASNQVLYHLGSRGIEWDLLPYCRRAEIMVMAYSPLGQGPLLRKPPLARIAAKHGVTPAAIALAFVLRQPGVVTIPKAVDPAHVKANLAALDVTLETEDLRALDAAFPPPKGTTPLEMT
ncbi:MAG TPA: aldo/keto reductase [Hyphomicrobiaceae bacterium]|nr:aldo/keto reductase [Hyphomicrobiaceae bacterium]